MNQTIYISQFDNSIPKCQPLRERLVHYIALLKKKYPQTGLLCVLWAQKYEVTEDSVLLFVLEYINHLKCAGSKLLSFLCSYYM